MINIKKVVYLIVLVYLSLSFCYSVTLADEVDDFKVLITDNQVYHTSEYNLKLILSSNAYSELKNGSLRLTFPNGFNLNNIDSIAISDNIPNIAYSINRIEVNQQMLSLFFSQENNSGKQIDATIKATVNLNIYKIINPTLAGEYQLSAALVKRNGQIIAGPELSEQFIITPGELVNLLVQPSNDMAVKAGRELHFTAVGVDQYLNRIDNLDILWSIDPSGDNIGHLEDSILFTTTVGSGKVIAKSNGFTGNSGIITVTPGDLSRIVLDIEEVQVVGQPFVETSTISLFDNFNNRKTDYNLNLNPIKLNIYDGLLYPEIINNNNYLSNGIIDLHDIGFYYSGKSVKTDIIAETDIVTSNRAELYFNNYDIIDLTAINDKTITHIFSGIQSSAYVHLINNGNIAASQNILIKSGFLSNGQLTETNVAPPDPGIKGVFEITLPGNFTIGNDTIIIITESQFEINGQSYSTKDTQYFPVIISETVVLKYVEDSFTPSEITTGANISFKFDITNESNLELEFVPESSHFELTGDNFSGLAFIFNLTGDILSGDNSFYSGLIAIPSDLTTEQLEASIDIAYKIPGTDDIRHFTFIYSPITLTIAPAVQVNGLEIIAPNSPFANTSQHIIIEGIVINYSEHQADNLTVQLKSFENYSQIVNDTQIISLLPSDTNEVLFDVIVSDTSPDLPEKFELNILNNNIIILPPINNQTFLFIDNPANLKLEYRLNGISDADNIQIDPGKQFIFSFELTNLGDADITPVNYRLIVNGLNSNPDTSIGQIGINTSTDLIYNAPVVDKTITFSLELLNTPIDINSNAPAALNRDNFHFTLNVLTIDANLLVITQKLGIGLVIPGVITELTELNFDNTDQLNLSDIQLNQFRVKLTDANDNDLDPAELIDISETGFYENGVLVSNAIIEDEWIVFNFIDMIITPTDNRTLIFAVQYKESDLDFIKTRGPSNGLSAIFVSGPYSGQSARVNVYNNEPYLIEHDIVFVQTTLANSFIIDDNPFNPHNKDASFSFYIDEPAKVEFRIFTLAGEQVYFMSIPEEEIIANSINYINWDGKNSNGRLVRNGVYISYITNTKTGESARIKIALVK